MIRIENVTKSYMTLRGRKFVFRDLSFEIPAGANVGLIGRNGAGKSTLMRLLSCVELPDKGKITTQARLSWPVGLTGGMQKNLSGRDNVKFVCRVYGVRKAGMKEKIRYVEEFAEIDEYFDQPVATYSSGMRARLAFGMSMAFDFDYYLIDEVMAVGDASFKQKSQQAFDERLRHSKVIIVSHNMKIVKRMCDLVIYLERGRPVLYEDVDEGIAAYQAMIHMRGRGRDAADDDDESVEAAAGDAQPTEAAAAQSNEAAARGVESQNAAVRADNEPEAPQPDVREPTRLVRLAGRAGR